MGLRSGIAIDLGTVNSLVHVHGHGVVLEEPSAVARLRTSGKIVGIGAMADRLAGREPVNTVVVHPLRDGVISDLDAATRLVQAFLRKVRFRTSALKPRAVMCVPSGATPVEREALVAAANFGHPRLDVRLLEEPVAAAAGSGVDPATEDGVFVVDIGGGTTEAAVIVGARVVTYRSLRLAGNAMDEAIEHEVRTELGLRIGHRDAERLKFELGLDGNGHASAKVAGVDLHTGTVSEVEVGADIVAAALDRTVSAIAETVLDLLSAVPPDFARDVVARHVRLAGGGALLSGLAGRIEEVSGASTVVVGDPLRAVVRGAALLLEESFEALDETA